jgi:hypothetical protein
LQPGEEPWAAWLREELLLWLLLLLLLVMLLSLMLCTVPSHATALADIAR